MPQEFIKKVRKANSFAKKVHLETLKMQIWMQMRIALSESCILSVGKGSKKNEEASRKFFSLDKDKKLDRKVTATAADTWNRLMF